MAVICCEWHIRLAAVRPLACARVLDLTASNLLDRIRPCSLLLSDRFHHRREDTVQIAVELHRVAHVRSGHGRLVMGAHLGERER